ncbi:MAG: sulfite exporter TauE/SafE family protein [Gammaproteobacteria bacterium]|nr:MAG: sulfite exporter TauE/SafE family protein [Gammaproteobacteria bacterium]
MTDISHITLPAVLLMGLAFGAGPCNVTCLPYLGPVFLQGEGIRGSWRILLPFTLGRLSGYGALGLIAGLAGQLLVDWLQSSLAGWILGIAAIGVGLRLFLQNNQKPHCYNPSTAVQSIHFHPRAQETTYPMAGALYVMGLGMALNPCVPLATVLAAAATSGSTLSGLSLGLSFGMGAVMLPTLFFGVLVAHFGRELRLHLGHWKHAMERASGSLLILLGVATTAGWIQP